MSIADDGDKVLLVAFKTKFLLKRKIIKINYYSISPESRAFNAGSRERKKLKSSRDFLPGNSQVSNPTESKIFTTREFIFIKISQLHLKFYAGFEKLRLRHIVLD